MIEKCFLHQDIKMCVIYIERVKEGRKEGTECTATS